ncbi:hypothetical protein ES703_124575 [subsurface metagenome]
MVNVPEHCSDHWPFLENVSLAFFEFSAYLFFEGALAFHDQLSAEFQSNQFGNVRTYGLIGRGHYVLLHQFSDNIG